MADIRFARVIAGLAAAFWLVSGFWLFVAPHSFFEHLANFPPYNRHFLHDAGVFSIGLGSVLLLALLRWPALPAALGGVAVASVLHVVSHVVDRDLGGRDSDPYGLGLLAALTVVAAFVARPRSRVESPTR